MASVGTISRQAGFRWAMANQLIPCPKRNPQTITVTAPPACPPTYRSTENTRPIETHRSNTHTHTHTHTHNRSRARCTSRLGAGKMKIGLCIICEGFGTGK